MNTIVKIPNQKQPVSIVRNTTAITTEFPTPTLLQYQAIQKAFDYYNQNLFLPVFGVLLPPVMFSLNESHKSYGYYAFEKYCDESGRIVCLINLSPEYLSRDFEEVLGTFVHECCHHYQFFFGKKPFKKTAYHDLEFAGIMERVGLICSDTKLPGGKKNGYQMSHYIQEGGLFEKLTASISDEIRLPFTYIQTSNFQDKNSVNNPYAEVKRKVKYQCPNCRCNAWGKSNMLIACLPCLQIMVN